MPRPRQVTFSTPVATPIGNSQAQIAFSWVLPTTLGGTVATGAVTLYLPTTVQALRDALRAFIDKYEQGIPGAALQALAGITATVDLDALGT